MNSLAREAPSLSSSVSAADQRSAPARKMHIPGGRRPFDGEVKGSILFQDPSVQIPKVGAGIDAEFLGKKCPRFSERRQRLRLAAAAVEREHPLAPKPFPVGVVGEQGEELTRGSFGLARLEQRLDAVLLEFETGLFELGANGLHPLRLPGPRK